MSRLFLLIATILGLARAELAVAREAVVDVPRGEFSEQIRPILERHCVSCHGRKTREGGVDLDEIRDSGSAARKQKLWRRAEARVAAGEMPPDGEQPVADADRERLLAWMRSAATSFRCEDRENRDPGPSTLRRLSRREYDRTITDLIGLRFDSSLAVGLPEDGGSGFDTLAAALDLSAARVEKYFSAADEVIERLFAETAEARNARARLFIARPGGELSAKDAASRILRQFVRRAYRRPPTAQEMARILEFYDRAVESQAPFESAIRAALKPILVSPSFLLLLEKDQPAQGDARAVLVDDHELAVRLSYFLWSSMPDDELFRLADEGRLADPATLRDQVRRMLASSKANALTEGFAVSWLQLKKLPAARPSTEFFPTFNDRLKRSMDDEVRVFFDKLREQDRSLLELIDSDYAYVNDVLAEHYGIKGISGREIRKVALHPEQHRGGLLGMAGILAMTSHTFRTSPTQRGKYVLEVIFGTPPPPPPPDAGMLKDDRPASKDGPKSFREKMAMHASAASCAGCHKKIDPLGFALENYDAIGSWRVSTSGTPLDIGGVLPGGEKVEDSAALKRVILARKDDFARNLVERMLAYAIGRDLDEGDECTIREVLDAVKRADYRFSSLIGAVVESVPFRYRRAAAAKP